MAYEMTHNTARQRSGPPVFVDMDAGRVALLKDVDNASFSYVLKKTIAIDPN